MFELGILPAVDVGKSVSRVGGKAQRVPFRAVAGNLKLAYAQFEELETFSRFGARLDQASREVLDHGERIRACLQQAQFAPESVPGQIALLLTLTAGLFDPVTIRRMPEAVRAVMDSAARIPARLCARFETPEALSDEEREAVLVITRAALVGLST